MPSANVIFSAGSTKSPAPQPAYSCGVLVYDESNDAHSRAGIACGNAIRRAKPSAPVELLQFPARVHAEGIGNIAAIEPKDLRGFVES